MSIIKTIRRKIINLLEEPEPPKNIPVYIPENQEKTVFYPFRKGCDYFYNTKYRIWSLSLNYTKKGLHLNAQKGIQSIKLHLSGYKISEITVKIGYTNTKNNRNKINYFIKIYETGRLDHAIGWICDNHIEGVNEDKYMLFKRLKK